MPSTLLVPPSLGAARATARAELLEGSFGNELGLDVRVRVARDYGELQREAIALTTEMVWAPSAVIAQLNDVRVILRAVRDRHGHYHSAVIARADRKLSASNLRRARAAWVDPLSAGGYLLPLAWLRGQGIEPNLVFDAQDFLGSHRAVVDAVLAGTHDIAAVSTPARDPETLRRALHFYAGGAADKLTVLGVSDSVPTDALVITSKVEPLVAERMASKLLPPIGKGRTPSSLLSAMEAERLERVPLDEYRAMRSLLWTRRSDRPPVSRR
jgi:phosphonate transport system substrate-binding protein